MTSTDTDNPHTLKITTVLTGSENYHLWRRQMELALSAKRKLGYVIGKTVKPREDEEKIEAWVVANNQVITWILQNVSERIKMVIIYTPTAKGIWDVLEKQYTVTNGARKFKLNKETYEITQHGRSIEDYYTQLQMVWDELENMCTLPSISKITTDVAEYLKAVETQAEEKKLFQFLNGLDKEYGILRSNILLMDPLPSEEVQATNLGGAKSHEMSALMSKGDDNNGRCMGHPKHKKPYQKPGYRSNSWAGAGFRSQKNFQGNGRQFNNNDEYKTDQPDLTAAIGITHHSELTRSKYEWVIDSGATDHMSSHLDVLSIVKTMSEKPRVNLPNGGYVRVTHKGDVTLRNGLQLKNVLYVPEFQQNLPYVQRLIRDNGCDVIFSDSHCCVQGYRDGETKRLGEAKYGLYYLTTFLLVVSLKTVKKFKYSSLWHHRLGHAPWSKIKHLNHLKIRNNVEGICLSCPMAKFTKLLFPKRQTTIEHPFDMIYIDI
ncbi:hypothetical protein RND81_08G075400 [Saponaria officinalis]|uniref:Retrotransposon Copia-like N-terminal domain-containing protein n=1 Tax=Saponaria officinalis TaxID=3572 RepID=A0AAW1J4X3_SAPOF